MVGDKEESCSTTAFFLHLDVLLLYVCFQNVSFLALASSESNYDRPDLRYIVVLGLFFIKRSLQVLL